MSECIMALTLVPEKEARGWGPERHKIIVNCITEVMETWMPILPPSPLVSKGGKSA